MATCDTCGKAWYSEGIGRIVTDAGACPACAPERFTSFPGA